MEKYFHIFYNSLQDTIEYRFDFVLQVMKYSMMVLLMALVWTAVGQASGNSLLASSQTVTYFFAAALLYSLSNFHTYYIDDDIRLGNLVKYLVKPVSVFWYYFWYQLAITTMETLLKLVGLVPLLLVLRLPLTLSVEKVLVFILFAIVINLFSFSLQSSISFLNFWFTEAYAIRWSVLIFIRLLSGMLVPLYIFPDWFKQVSPFFPFQHLAFTPIQTLLGAYSTTQAYMYMGVLLLWTVIAYGIQALLWKKGVTEYDAVGN